MDRTVNRNTDLTDQPMTHEQGTLQATRALMVISILLGAVAILASCVGMQCTTCLAGDEGKKAKVAGTGGILFILSGLLALVATAWYGNNVVRDFYNPAVPVNTRFEFGQALFIGWAAAALSMLGGAFLTCSCAKGGSSGRSYPRSTPSAPKNYV
ncbi:claudin-1-like [Mobula birostris]|uniref:claudin-1-like n=1 Tax=Mobula birostris TaxID=1983395 RepID=UPI003B27C457